MTSATGNNTHHLSLETHHSCGSTNPLRSLKQQVETQSLISQIKKKQFSLCKINYVTSMTPHRWTLGSHLSWTSLVSFFTLKEQEGNIGRKTKQLFLFILCTAYSSIITI